MLACTNFLANANGVKLCRAGISMPPCRPQYARWAKAVRNRYATRAGWRGRGRATVAASSLARSMIGDFAAVTGGYLTAFLQCIACW
jgi:hypothetical protein